MLTRRLYGSGMGSNEQGEHCIYSSVFCSDLDPLKRDINLLYFNFTLTTISNSSRPRNELRFASEALNVELTFVLLVLLAPVLADVLLTVLDVLLAVVLVVLFVLVLEVELELAVTALMS